MKYLLMMHYNVEGVPPMDTWSEEDIRAHIDFQHALGKELRETGELVGAEGLTPPDEALIVTSDGRAAPVVTDGPFPESKEFLAGYWMIEVGGRERAVEIAAKASAAPGPNGVPIKTPIEVRRIGEAPATDGS